MHESTRQLGQGLASVFKERGWRKRALTWHKAGADTVLVFHTEKNRWGANEYSFHCGVYLRALGAESTPPCHRCPVQVTLDRLAPDATYIDRISNFEDSSLSTASRIEAIVGAVQTHALPWLQEHATLRGLMELANVDYEELLSRVVVWRAAYDYLATLRRSA